MKSTPKILRKVLIALAGFTLIVIGIVLLVLPGPGLLLIALGLFVLSWEFEWADKHYRRLEVHAQKFLAKFRKKL